MIGQRIRSLRRKKNLTIAALAELANIGEDTLSNIELDKQKPRSRNIQKIANALNIKPEDLIKPECFRQTIFGKYDDWNQENTNYISSLLDGSQTITTQSIDRIVHEWLVSPPPQLVEIKSGRRIGENLVKKIERRVIQIRRMDDFVGGRDLLPLVNREVIITGNLLRNAAYSEKIGKRLFSAIAKLCQLAGWIASDAGDHKNCLRAYRIGIEIAHLANDRVFAGNLISALAYHLTNRQDYNDGVLLSQSALHGAGKLATRSVKTLYLERSAWALACAGLKKQAEKKLAEVEITFNGYRPEFDPEWVYWLNPDEITIMAARCFVKLNQPQKAINLLSNILQQYDGRRTREIALYTSWLSEAYLLAREIESAAHYAVKTADLSLLTNSARSDNRVKELSELLKPYAKNHSVKNFITKIKEL